jgi:hypothetical protein
MFVNIYIQEVLMPAGSIQSGDHVGQAPARHLRLCEGEVLSPKSATSAAPARHNAPPARSVGFQRRDGQVSNLTVPCRKNRHHCTDTLPYAAGCRYSQRGIPTVHAAPGTTLMLQRPPPTKRHDTHRGTELYANPKQDRVNLACSVKGNT